MVVLSAFTKEGDANGKDVIGRYIDLGLPSGTKWKDINESHGDFNLYTYDQAISLYGEKLPTKEQFEELQHSCMWTWQDGAYKVVGPNGKSIYLPAAGGRWCTWMSEGVGGIGYYCSSTPDDSERAWYLNFNSREVSMYNLLRCHGASVRLVQD